MGEATIVKDAISPPIPHVVLPPGSKQVRVRAIDTTTRLACDPGLMMEPAINDNRSFEMQTMCFLLDHQGEQGTEHVLFDCGSRKDFWNSSPHTCNVIATYITGLEVKYGVHEILESSGFNLENLSRYTIISQVGGKGCVRSGNNG